MLKRFALATLDVAACLGVAAVFAFVVVAVATPAKADPWNGCYLGVGAGYSMAMTDTSLSVPAGTLGVDGLGAQGAGVTGLLGCDIKPAPQFLVGVWGDYTHDPDTTFSVYATGIPNLLEASLENRWGGGGRLGWLPNQRTLLYVLAGYTQAQPSNITSPAAGPGAFISVPDLKGYVVGGGAEVYLSNGFFLQAQGTYADYRKESIALGPATTLGLDTDVLTARVAVTYKLSFTGPDLSNTPALHPVK